MPLVDFLKKKYQLKNMNSLRLSNNVYSMNANSQGPINLLYKYCAGDIVEYVSNKGCKRLALVYETKGIVSRKQSLSSTEQLTVTNELSDKSYDIPINKITYHILAPGNSLKYPFYIWPNFECFSR